MEQEQKDFFKGNSDNIHDYFFKMNKNSQGPDQYDSFCARIFSTLFNNKENRINNEENLKIISQSIAVDYRVSGYTRIEETLDNMKNFFNKLENEENGNKMKDYFTQLQKFFAVKDFKKTAQQDLTELEDGSIAPSKLNKIVNATIIMKGSIEKDEQATNLFNKMMDVSIFKNEYNLNSQRLNDLKEFRNLKDEIDGLEQFKSFYKVKTNDFTAVPTGNDHLSVEYREKIFPQIEKINNLLDRLDLDKNYNKRNFIGNMNLSLDEQDQYNHFKSMMTNFAVNKAIVEQLKKTQNLDVEVSTMNIINDDIVKPSVKKSDKSYYANELDYVEKFYDHFSKPDSNLSIHRQISDMKEIQNKINRLPSQPLDATDALKITQYKKAIVMNDFILLGDFNNLSDSFDKLRQQGVLEHVNTHFKHIEYQSNSPYTPDIKNNVAHEIAKISEVIGRIEKKFGNNIDGLLDKQQQTKFTQYKQIVNAYEQYEIKRQSEKKLSI